MPDRTWSGAVAAHVRGGSAAYGAWLRTPSGILVWRSAERVGDVTLQRTVERGVGALLQAALAHRAGKPRIAVWPEAPLRGDVAQADVSEDCEALTLAESVLPPPPAFAAAGLEYIEPGHYVAHGTRDYQVWPQLDVCSCPAFTYGASRPCKHLKAALAADPCRNGTTRITHIKW